MLTSNDKMVYYTNLPPKHEPQVAKVQYSFHTINWCNSQDLSCIDLSNICHGRSTPCHEDVSFNLPIQFEKINLSSETYSCLFLLKLITIFLKLSIVISGVWRSAQLWAVREVMRGAISTHNLTYNPSHLMSKVESRELRVWPSTSE